LRVFQGLRIAWLKIGFSKEDMIIICRIHNEIGTALIKKELRLAAWQRRTGKGIGYFAATNYPNAPAQHVAQRSHVIDMTDTDAVKKLIALEQPDFIIPEIEAIATQALVDIEAEGSCTVVPNARAIQLTMNREGIRTLAAEQLKIPTSAYALLNRLKSCKLLLRRYRLSVLHQADHVIIGKGQSMVKSAEQLKAAWDYAKSSGRVDTGKVIVEAKIEFDFEITLLTWALTENGEVETCFCAPIGQTESGDYWRAGNRSL
jgi:phosphoribosylglycinamide formyltransferase 2